ncbi:hypothetical protein PMIN04_009139 [Paraphaeosphaeria minitans]
MLPAARMQHQMNLATFPWGMDSSSYLVFLNAQIPPMCLPWFEKLGSNKLCFGTQTTRRKTARMEKCGCSRISWFFSPFARPHHVFICETKVAGNKLHSVSGRLLVFNSTSSTPYREATVNRYVE